MYNNQGCLVPLCQRQQVAYMPDQQCLEWTSWGMIEGHQGIRQMELQKALRKVQYVTLTKRRQVHYPEFKVARNLRLLQPMVTLTNQSTNQQRKATPHIYKKSLAAEDTKTQHRQMNADERTQACQSQRTVWQQQQTIGSEIVHEQQRTDPYSPKTLDGKDVTPHVPAPQTPFTTPKDQERPYRVDKWTAQLRPKQH